MTGDINEWETEIKEFPEFGRLELEEKCLSIKCPKMAVISSVDEWQIRCGSPCSKNGINLCVVHHFLSNYLCLYLYLWIPKSSCKFSAGDGWLVPPSMCPEENICLAFTYAFLPCGGFRSHVLWEDREANNSAVSHWSSADIYKTYSCFSF